MLKPRSELKIFMSTEAIDMRKSIDTLSILVAQSLGDDPLSGHLFIFFNRARDKIKILYWDRNGYVLHYKRMERQRFIIPRTMNSSVLILSETQLNGLLAGLDFTLMAEFYEINYDVVF